MSKILITVASGMLGPYVIDRLKHIKDDILIACRESIDLTKPENIFPYISKISPNIILHLAAETDVDLCEHNPSIAGVSNHLSTEQIVRAAFECNSWLLFVSSCSVFGDDSKFIYNEFDMPKPINYYGLSKLKGEMSVRDYCLDNHLIVRPGWVFGGDARDHKFVGNIIRQINLGVKTIETVCDRVGNITCADQLSEFIFWAMNIQQTGTYHYASDGVISLYDIAKENCSLLNYTGDIVSAKSALFPASAPRPKSEAIESIYLSRLVNAPVPNNWKDDLAKYINNQDLELMD